MRLKGRARLLPSRNPYQLGRSLALPYTMSSNELAARYRELGYLIVDSLFSLDEVASLRQRTEAIASGEVDFPTELIEYEPGREGERTLSTVRKLNRCADADDVFFRHASEDRVLNIVESLIGPDIKLFGSQCFMKPPGGIEKPYHQDSAYFSIEPFDLVTCWTALDDVTEENGCVWVVPGSHTGGVIDHSQPWQLPGRTDMQIPDEQIAVELETPLVMEAGSCSFHHSLIMHKSMPNCTDKSRRGFAVHYMSAQSKWTDASHPPRRFPLLRGREYEGCV